MSSEILWVVTGLVTGILGFAMGWGVARVVSGARDCGPLPPVKPPKYDDGSQQWEQDWSDACDEYARQLKEGDDVYGRIFAEFEQWCKEIADSAKSAAKKKPDEPKPPIPPGIHLRRDGDLS